MAELRTPERRLCGYDAQSTQDLSCLKAVHQPYSTSISFLYCSSTTTMSTEPPPLYTTSDNDEGPSTSEDVLTESDDPQILIIPPSQSAQFQKGYLGADDERAAIEGELQIKGISASACRKVYVHLQPPQHP